VALSVAALRRIAVAAQGFSARTRTATEDEVEGAVQRLSAVQIDALGVVERSQRVVIGSRVGEFPHGAISSLLVREGLLREIAVDDGGAPVYVEAGAELDVDPGRTAVLLSPFDNLLWDRPLCERLFGFAHVIEI
jgi:uncharacterized protein YcaQ